MAGQPPKYNNKEELQNKIDSYFKEGMKIKEVIVGKGQNQTVLKIETPTITGLALYCGFASRQSFYDYEKIDEFSYAIKRSRTLIEQHYEELLQTGNTTGAIFALKNMSWSDKQELDHTSKGEKLDSKTEVIFKNYKNKQ